jgi:hypothetical protein
MIVPKEIRHKMPTSQSTFDALYLASLPPAVAALFKLPAASAARIAAAYQLAKSGTLIDYTVQVNGWDAFDIMTDRIALGETWVPSMLQSNLGQPDGIAEPGEPLQPGQTAYDPSKPPAGSIKVSVNPADYPPFVPPTPVPTPTPITSAVGINEGAGYYSVTTLGTEMFVSGQLTDGQTYTADPRGTFTFHASPDPFGVNEGDFATWFKAE